MFQFDPSVLPSLRTRKALLILDVQHDFVAAEGALPVTEPAGFVQRTVDVAKAFRESGSGDVLWIRSEFEKHRPIENEQVLLTDVPVPNYLRRSAAAASRSPATPPEADDEAFLSLAGEGRPARAAKPLCVRAGTAGAALAAKAAAAVDTARDSVLTKTDYSAFQSGKLLQLLRGRFATELFVCGALTNVSIHATALDAARHGFAMTIIDDCCGFRSQMRHWNAIRHLTQMTGCETTTAEDLIASLCPSPKPTLPSARAPTGVPGQAPGRSPAAGIGPIRTGGSPKLSPRNSPRESPKDKFVGDASGREQKRPDSAHRHLPEAFDELRLSDDCSPAAAKSDPAQPQADEPPVQPLVVGSGPGSRGSANDADGTKAKKTSNKPPNPGTSPIASKDISPPSGSEEDLEPDTKAQATPPPRVSAPVAAQSALRSQSDDAASESPESGRTKQKEPDRNGQASAKGANDTPKPNPKKLPKDVSAPAKTPDTGPSLNDSDRVNIQAEMSSDDEAPIAKMKQGARPTPSEPLCEGDTTVFHDVLPASLEAGIFERLRDEVRWLRMSHQGGEVPRLVCVQGEIDDDGNMPVYRHPADESPPLVPFSPTVLQIKAEVEKLLGHPLNHALIQFYRSGNDYISEHSDKTLDITKGSFIANVSLGAERTMVFRTKRPDKDPSMKSEVAAAEGEAEDPPGATGLPKRQTIRARLPHNSLCRMGLRTNERWLHAIRQDRRQARDKTPSELAFSGGRISLTFRQIGTFLDRDNAVVWGQGATSKTREGAKAVVNGQTEEAVRMLKAFGTENHSSTFDWDAIYGGGFDVLHMHNAPRFFSSADPVVNMRIQLMLAEYGVAYAKGSMGPAPGGGASKDGTDAPTGAPESLAVKFVDNDAAKSSIQGDVAIMLYVEGVYGPGKAAGAGVTSHPDPAKKFTSFQQALALLDKWRSATSKDVAGAGGGGGGDEKESSAPSPRPAQLMKPFTRDLAIFEAYATETFPAGGGGGFIAGGDAPSIADFTLWPVLHDIAAKSGGDDAFVSALKHLKMDKLARYYESFRDRRSAQHVLDGNSYGAAGEPREKGAVVDKGAGGDL